MQFPISGGNGIKYWNCLMHTRRNSRAFASSNFIRAAYYGCSIENIHKMIWATWHSWPMFHIAWLWILFHETSLDYLTISKFTLVARIELLNTLPNWTTLPTLPVVDNACWATLTFRHTQARLALCMTLNYLTTPKFPYITDTLYKIFILAFWALFFIIFVYTVCHLGYYWTNPDFGLG